jgi:hypothetical protein
MAVLDRLKNLFRSPAVPGAGTAPAEALFVYVKIPAPIEPLERARRFADPLQQALQRAALGEVTGGGSQLSAPDEEGLRTIVYCGIDIDLHDTARGLALLRQELMRLEVPRGTVLQYRVAGEKHEQAVYEA